MSQRVESATPMVDPRHVAHRARTWRRAFLVQQTRTAAWLALAADLFFALLDHLLYPDRFWSLQRPRLLFAGGALLALLLAHRPVVVRRLPWLPLLTAYWTIAAALAWLNLLTGGFDSPYAFSFFLLTSGFGILVPAAPLLHLAGGLGGYLLYVVLGLLADDPAPEQLSRLLNLSFGYVAAVAIVVFAVTIYERLQHRRTRDQAALEIAHRRLRDLDAAKSRFFANVSHELRTPLTLVLGVLEQRLADHPDDAPLATALRNARRLARLIDDLLELATLQQTRVPLQPRRIDVAAMVAELVVDFAAGNPQHHFRYTGPSHGVPMVTDPRHLETILSNLLANAVKYTPAAGGAVEVELEAPPKGVRIHVRDNGPGIAPEHRDVVFAPFARIGDGRDEPGAGLGLALAKELAELLGGTIELESLPGAGSRFSLHLPQPTVAMVAESAPEASADARTDSPTWTPPGSSAGAMLPVLIVEDDPDLRELLRALLAPHYRVATATDGRHATELLDQGRYAAVITDLMMPSLDGLALWRRLRADARHRALPILVLTARGRGDLPAELAADPRTRLLHKPFETELLLATLARLLRSSV